MGGDVSTLPPLECGGASTELAEVSSLRSSVHHPADAYREAVHWMNVGCDHSMRAADEAAIAAYACAVEFLRPLPLTGRPAWANSLGAALMNQGQLLHRAHGVAAAAEARRLFAEAIRVLSGIDFAVVPWARRNLAGTYLNRANLALDELTAAGAAATAGAIEAALADANAALELVRVGETRDVVDAELALKVRRVQCDALGQLVALTSSRVQQRQDELASTAADVVDEALALVQAWRPRAGGRFDHLAVRFFRFGAELYRLHQPHFLVEFIEEHLGAAPDCFAEMQAIAGEVLDAALADSARPVLLTLDEPASERALQTRRDLLAARDRPGFGRPAA